MRTLHLILVCVLGFLFCSPAQALREQDCVPLYKQKRWSAAAACFEKTAQSLPADKKFYRGRLLRNAAQLWSRAVAQTTGVARATAKRRAVLLLDVYVRQQLCLDATRCQKVAKQRNALCQKYGCATLRVEPQPLSSQVTVSWDFWSVAKKGVWEASLPPGEYRLQITSKNTKPHLKTVLMRPDAPRLLRIKLVALTPSTPLPPKQGNTTIPGTGKAPATKARIPLFAWLGYIGGGLLVAGGGALVGIGVSQRGALVERWRDPTELVKIAERDKELTESRNTALAGGLGIGLGVLLVGGGVITHMRALRQPAAANTTQVMPRKRASRVVSLVRE